MLIKLNSNKPSSIILPSPSPQTLTSQTHSTHTPIPPHALHKSIKSHFPTPTPPKIPYESPKTLADIQRTILSARRQLRRLKPTTNPQSPSSIAAHKAGALIVDTSNLTSITRTKHTATAQCGARLTQLPLPVVCPDMSIGAALADGSLALGGFAQGLVADCLLAISVVDSRGRLRMYKKDDPTGIFQTVVVSHGLCGIIFDATFTTSYTERVVGVSIRLRGMSAVTSEGLRSIVDGRTAVEISWVPFNSYTSGDDWDARQDGVIVKAVESTMSELSPGRGVRYLTIPDYIIRNCGTLAAAGYQGFEGWHTKVILSQGYKVMEESFVTTLSEAVRGEYEGRGVCEESVCFSMRLEEEGDWERVVRAWEFVVGLVKEYDNRGKYPLNVLMKMRFVGGSEGLMAVNEGMVGCLLTIVSAVGTAGWTELAKTVVEEWVLMGGRWMVNRDGVGVVDERIGRLKQVVRNAGLDDYGMFEDFVVGFREVRVLESVQSISDISDLEEEVVLQESKTGELSWVWLYVVCYVLIWCWLFGEEAVYTILDVVKSE